MFHKKAHSKTLFERLGVYCLMAVDLFEKHSSSFTPNTNCPKYTIYQIVDIWSQGYLDPMCIGFFEKKKKKTVGGLEVK